MVPVANTRPKIIQQLEVDEVSIVVYVKNSIFSVGGEMGTKTFFYSLWILPTVVVHKLDHDTKLKHARDVVVLVC